MPVEFVPISEIASGDLVRVRLAPTSGPLAMLTVQRREADGVLVARAEGDDLDVIVRADDVLAVLRLIPGSELRSSLSRLAARPPRGA